MTSTELQVATTNRLELACGVKTICHLLLRSDPLPPVLWDTGQPGARRGARARLVSTCPRPEAVKNRLVTQVCVTLCAQEPCPVSWGL